MNELLGTFLCMSFVGHKHSFFLHSYSGIELSELFLKFKYFSDNHMIVVPF